MIPTLQARRDMKQAENAFLEIARAHFANPTRDSAARYHERLESLVASYESYQLARGF